MVTARATGDAGEPGLVRAALNHGRKVRVVLPRFSPRPAAGSRVPLLAERYAAATSGCRLDRDRLVGPRRQPRRWSIPD